MAAIDERTKILKAIKSHKKEEKQRERNHQKAKPKSKMFSRTAFLNILEKATSHLQLEPDWNSIIAVSDCIRQGDVEPKFALNSIKKKINGPNLHVNMFGLLVLESCVKNCGPTFHAEVATKSFMEELHEIVKGNTNEKIKEKILELVQAWAHAFRNQPNYRPVLDMCNLLKLEGFKFPTLKEADAMFSASVAPEWVDGDVCHRCRVTFSLLERRHHCRNCGQVFCNKCSSRTSILPKYGIEKEVRVCEDCYEKANTTTIPKSTAAGSVAATDKNKTGAPSSSKTPTSPPGKTDEELREEEELQMAIALSRSEAEVKEKQQRKYSNSYQSFNNFERELNKSPPQTAIDKEQLDPNLNLYMNRAYWEQKSKENSSKRLSDAKPSAPQQTLAKNSSPSAVKQGENEQPYGNTTTTLLKSESDEENNIEQFQNNLRSTIEIFVNRMNSNKNRGRPISNDSAVQSMFLNITNMHSQLLKHIQQQDDQRSKFELLQDKLSQAKDARAALDSLREEYNEKLRREAEEAEMIRQQQMAFKLDIMRKKKQEYLQYQRQIALQRIQDEERQMKMRLEQQKYGVWPNAAPQMPPGQQSYPAYPIQNYSQPITYGDPSSIYSPHQMPQQHLPNPVNQYPPQPNGAIPYSPMQQQQQQPPPTNPHISTPQQVIQPPPHLEMPIHHQQPTDPSSTVTYPTPGYGHQPAGVYNMQAMSNSLPAQQPYANQPTSQPEHSQVNISVDSNGVSAADASAVNTSAVNASLKQVEEAPLISFD